MKPFCTWGRYFSIWAQSIVLFSLIAGGASLSAGCTRLPPPPAPPPISKIRVVMDNNYPPYVFQDEAGDLKGIIIDQWKLWEERTGVKVELTARPWGEALEQMKAGEYDVIDTVFYTEERARLFDYTQPYAQINVLIFFNQNISGITNAKDLKGFRIAVKSGDANVEYLQNQGIDSLVLYPSYEEIIRAAARKEETIFVIDEPPALYYLYKYGIQDQFSYSAPLYGGAFHRAVKKGDAKMLALVEDGFARIHKSEYEAIQVRWFGRRPWDYKTLLPSLGLAGGMVLVLIFALATFNHTLSSQVQERTRELNENQKFLADVIEYSGALIFVKDRDGRYELVNRKWEEITGMKREQVIGMTDEELFPTPDAQQYRTNDQEAMETGHVIEVEETLENAQGNRYFISVKFPVHAKDGSVKSVCGMITEITDRKKAEEALRESEAQVRVLNTHLERRVAERTAQLELANREMEAFTYSVSHDLRAPLRAINGYARIIIDEYVQQMDGEVASMLQNICTASQNMDRLIASLLSLSRKTRVEMHWAQVDLSTLAQNTAAELQRTHPERQVEWVIQEQVTVQGDAYLLGVLLENLLDNAWKYTASNPAARIAFGVQVQDDKTVYFVQDNGVGFEMAHASKIFEAFQRLHAETEFQGEGIGLATVQRIVHRHGGQIWTEAEVGKGATFYFTLPPRG